jgi:4-amino-4-deoxy-L-arabinose transferase-like glycosyltransferase
MSTGAMSMARAADTAERPKTSGRWAIWMPYLLALLFGLMALRGVWQTGVVDTDASRHAMNGAFIYDMVRQGQAAHPMAYGQKYYSRMPALSMPFHPPGFPAIEALFYAVFGVNLLAARLAVAVAVAITAALFYRLILATLGSTVIAVCATVTTLSLQQTQTAARDVMLEFPAMAFTLAALYCLRDMKREYRFGPALLFALFASAAFWTKQHTVFVGIVPFLYAIFLGKWRLFFGKAIWVSSAIFGAAVLSYVWLSKSFHGVAVNTIQTSPASLQWIFFHNVRFYGAWLQYALFGLPIVFAVIALGVYGRAVYRRKQPTPSLALYWAWIVSFTAVIMFHGECSGRYWTFVIPAWIVVGYALLYEGCLNLWGERRGLRIAGGMAAAWFLVGLIYPPEFLRGPATAAATVVNGAARRVLYCGEGDGNFMFAVRSLDPNLKMTVLSGDKLPAHVFQPNALDEFCRRYRIDWIVIENVTARKMWTGLQLLSAPTMKLERSIPLESSRSRWRGGTLSLYRFTGPHATGNETLQIPVPKLGGSVDVQF